MKSGTVRVCQTFMAVLHVVLPLVSKDPFQMLLLNLYVPQIGSARTSPKPSPDVFQLQAQSHHEVFDGCHAPEICLFRIKRVGWPYR